MAKWKIVARPDEEDCHYGLKPQEKIIEAKKLRKEGLSFEKIHIHNLRRTAAVPERRSGGAGAWHLHLIRI